MAWSFGVRDGAQQLETCTNSCEPGLSGSSAGQLWHPAGIAVDAAGDVYVGDDDNARIDKFSATGSFIRAWGWGVADGASRSETCTTVCQSGLSGSGAGQLQGPDGIAVDASGDVYVLDAGRVDEFSGAGTFIEAWGWGVADGADQLETCTSICQAASSFVGPEGGLTIDGAGDVYTGDVTDRIDEFSSSGDLLRAWGWGVPDGAKKLETCTVTCDAGIPGAGVGQLWDPGAMVADSSGDIDVLDGLNRRIDEFSPTGSFVEASGWGVADGASRFESCTSSCQQGSYGGGAGQLAADGGIADPAGKLIVADLNRIDEFQVTTAPAITSAAHVTLIAGSPGTFTVTATGFPVPGLSETGALPDGVSFHDHGDGTASLSGTPAAATDGTFPLTLTAHNGAGPDAVQPFTLTVTSAGTPPAGVARSSPPTTRPGVITPAPNVPGCPAATGRLSGTRLGLIRLGMTRGQARRAYSHSSTCDFRYKDFFCLTPRGIRVGYASTAPTQCAPSPTASRRRWAGSVGLDGQSLLRDRRYPSRRNASCRQGPDPQRGPPAHRSQLLVPGQPRLPDCGPEGPRSDRRGDRHCRQPAHRDTPDRDDPHAQFLLIQKTKSAPTAIYLLDVSGTNDSLANTIAQSLQLSPHP
jgi:hypothetical protein